MYTPNHFASTPPWQRLLADHSFGLLVSVNRGDCWTTHLPYLVAENGTVVALHMARANPHWRALQEQPRCRFVVQGAHGYVSPAWYETPAAVPTWNYQAIHLDCVAELVFDEASLWRIVAELTARFEEPAAAEVWALERLTGEFRASRLRSIVGVKLRVEHGEAKQKLSQDRTFAERRRVAAELRARGNPELAAAMESLLPASGEGS
jgi:transcriptional regulator